VVYDAHAAQAVYDAHDVYDAYDVYDAHAIICTSPKASAFIRARISEDDSSCVTILISVFSPSPSSQRKLGGSSSMTLMYPGL
jgi:hypothetical protein